ncbi:ligand-binding sensor domain-containing protein [Pedobacter metabolipauper]|uniref:Two component regulator with propeller domain n=1 Tax=Pedobacter metabolipauper TaxID=425513 RepID=A0A4R6SRX0_9SPHI|nr:sensor histidine kinase [Pedobacter metabolipauper]TDQ06427.1 two component regulator with propeller domain [Pedobacter metabolipauper]
MLTALLSFSVQVYSQTTYLQHFSTKNGLPSNNCFYTTQDSKGYIWVATDAGVSRFDGKLFENFSVDDGLPDNQILQLKEDKNGRIWFLALNGQLSYFFNGKIYNETNDRLLKSLKLNAVIVSFFEDSKGRIWLGTNKNLLVMWDGKSIKKYVSADHDRQFINTFIHEDKTGRIWAFSNRSVRTYDGNTFSVAAHKSLPISYKTALNLPGKSMVFIDTEGLKLRNGADESLQLKIAPELLNNDPGYFYFDDQENLWLSNAAGVHHIQKNGETKNYLTNISASQVIKDAKNNMWFTTSNGIYMLPQRDERLYLVNKSQGLSGDVIKSITKDNQNRLWLGLDEGKINAVSTYDFKVNEFLLPDKKKYNAIKHLSFDSANHAIYFASDYGLGRIKNIYSQKNEIDYVKETNNSMFVIKSFSISKNKSLSIALSSGVVILPDRFNKFEFSSFYFKEGSDFFSSRAYCVFYDKDQNLWFSNIKGLSKFSTSLKDYYIKSELLTRRINDIQQLNDGTMILATDGYGIIYIKDQKVIKVVTQRDGLADNICKKLFVKNNNVWVITNKGINKVILKERTVCVETFEYTNDLLADDVNSLYIDSDYAYFATNNGLVYFAVNKIKSIKTAPQVLISGIINNKIKLVLNQQEHVLDPSNNNITFYYSVIDFQNRNVSYRYRLKSQSNWTETKTRRLEFSSLEPGDYTFEISARFNDGNWSSPTRIKFILKEHFWQSYWFLILLFVVAGLAFYRIAVFVTKRQKNKEQEQLLLKNKILMLEQRALQAMMNPHFVFNVMNSIQHYINTKDTTSANKVLTGFARLIRKNLEICTKSYITLEEELEYLELYLSLEKKRFGGKLNYAINVDSSIDKEETLIPSMILQPYIENAIWHGIMPQEEGGKIDINIDLTDEDHLLIKIIDDGIGINNSLQQKTGQHQSKGMDLTKERINLLNQVEANPIQLEIKQNGESGTYVSITIPLTE